MARIQRLGKQALSYLERLVSEMRSRPYLIIVLLPLFVVSIIGSLLLFESSNDVTTLIPVTATTLQGQPENNLEVSAQVFQTTTTTRPETTSTIEVQTSESGEAMPAGNLPGWKFIFNDDFDTDVPLGQFPAAVDDKWGAYPYPWRDTKGKRDGYSHEGGWYHPEKTVSIKDGILNVSLRTENFDGGPKPVVAALQPKLFGPNTSGSKGQLYGRYAVRFRAEPVQGYKTAWLLWPDSETWPRDGELDFPEGNLDSTISGFMHWQGGTEGDSQFQAHSDATYAEWHTAVIEWQPNRVAYYLDGELLAKGGKSEWDQKIPNTPMHWVIQTETVLERGVMPAANSRGNVEIDWVAAWSYTP